MSNTWMHCIGILLLGYIIGYYFRSPGNMTIGKLYAGA
jgi:hypothetical protein